MADTYITPALFRFLEELKANNDRAWFEANRARYDSVVREPLLDFIEAFRPRLKAISRHLRAEARVGGSLFRIHRDTRFSPDKSPYKTHTGIQFRHSAGRDVHAPGFYVHLEPGNVYLGAGMWRPDRTALAAVRSAIVADPARWRRMKRTLAARGLELAGDSLKRAPRGFPAEHPLIEDLRRTDYITSVRLTEEDACRPDFEGRLADAFRDMSPLMRFLTRALGLPW
jgi:uncharacterized protein (TIGR02453 family)